MKRLLLLAAAVASIFTSCNKQFADDVARGASSNEIGFDTYLGNTAKGSIKDAFVMGDQFFVYGGNTGTGTFDVKNPSFGSWVFSDPANFPLDGALVSNYGGTPQVWRYDNPVAWTQDKVTFFGFSPVPVAGETYGITYDKPANLTTIPSIDFEVKGGYALLSNVTSPEAVASRPLNKQQVDLLAAVAVDQSNANGSVQMDFKHALTRLNFAVRSNAPTGSMIRINSIAVKNVATKGTLALAHDESATANPKPGDEAYVGGWEIDATAERKSFAVNLINSVASLIQDNAIHTITDNDEALMMIPQALADVELEVRYASSTNGTDWENYEDGVPVQVKLDQMGSHWNPNKQIRYILNITPGELIGFTAQVDPWDNETDSEYISKEVSKDAQDVIKLTLEVGDQIAADDDLAWITAQEGANAAQDVTKTTPIDAVAGEYTFAVKANLGVARKGKVTINHANGNQTVIAIDQAEGNGTIKAPVNGGNVVTFKLTNGDKVAIPQTKAAASWVKGNGAEIAAEYKAQGDEDYVISVDANTGEPREATIIVTISGTEIEYTIEQAGVATETVNATAGANDNLKTIALLAGDKIVGSAAAWLTIDGTPFNGTEIDATDKGYTFGVLANATTSERSAEITVTASGVITKYTFTQAGIATETVNATIDANASLKTIALLASDKIAGSAADWLTINGTPFDGNEIDATAQDYVFGVLANTTGAERSADITVTAAAGTITKYTFTQAGTISYTAIAANAAGAITDLNITLAAGDKILPIDGGANWLIATDAATAEHSIDAEINTADTYAVSTAVNSSAERKAKFITVISGVVVGYEVTQAAATEITISQIALDGTSTEVVALVAGDKILAGTDVSWLTLTSPATTETYTGTEVEVTDAGDWTVAGSDNTTSQEVRSGSFTVLKADGNVVVYTVSQANA